MICLVAHCVPDISQGVYNWIWMWILKTIRKIMNNIMGQVWKNEMLEKEEEEEEIQTSGAEQDVLPLS